MSTYVSKGAKIRNRYNQVPHLTQESDKLFNHPFELIHTCGGLLD